MSLDELIGARLVLGFHGTEATDELIARLRALHAQNLIVFERNFISPEQFTRFIRTLEAALEHRLLVMVDHEGGRVIRFRSGVTRFPDASSQGRLHSVQAIEQQGATEAEELKRLGVCLNLAPCVDVRMQGADPVIGDRSYGSDPSCVAQYGVARIQGLQTHGVGACAKHFPGLGAVQRDPHKVLPTIELDAGALDAVHLVPFRSALAAGVASVMSSHVCYPRVDETPSVPATFSPQLIQRLLRDTLQFSGLILTDDLEMGALRQFGSMGELAIRATEAGHDLLLICSDLSKAEEALPALHQAYRSARLSTAALEASVERLRIFKQKFLTPSP